MQSLVNITDQKAVTTSLIVAEAFDKQHKNVLRDITKLECSEEFTELNFEPSAYTDSTGRMLPMYNITRDGFTFLAMGFSGKKAAEFKEKFITAFNAMERALREDEGDVRRVEFNHTRGITNEHGLDIKYNLDLTKLCTKPTREGVKLLSRLTGIDMDDIAEDLEQAIPVPKVEPNVGDFARRCLRKNPDAWTEIHVLFQAYADFCKANKTRPLSRNAFCQQLYRLIPDLKRTRASYPPRPFGYVGVELAAADADVE